MAVEQIVKQRVVGAVVLVALAVIFIPALLEGPDERQAGSDLDMPQSMQDLREGAIESMEPMEQTLTVPPEQVTTVVIEQPTEAPASPQEPQAVVETAPVAEAPEPAVEPPPAPVPVPPAVPPVASGWVVQVGAFGQEANAMGLRDKLRKAGFATFVERVKLSSGTVYRVRVGPEIERADAEALQQKLADKTGVKGKVMSHP